METGIDQLKQAIQLGRQQEQQSGAMARYIEDNLDSLHSAIAISAASPAKALLSFIDDYIDTTPEHLQALYALAEEVKISRYAKAFLDLALTYFIKPPESIASTEGLQSLLYKAYLCHRLMEELNDQIMNLSGGVALAPMDMSMANIIAHSLIGDELNAQLDHLVLLTIETTPSDKGVFQQAEVQHLLEQHRFAGWDHILEKWPCFAKDCGVHLTIGASS